MWERFSYYGMRALLILYMVGSVRSRARLLDGEGGADLRPLHDARLSDGRAGRLDRRPFPRPLPRRPHRRNHHRVRPFQHGLPGIATFFLGLRLIIIGTGLLKPNVSTIVGTLYTRDDQRRDAGFSIFYMGINLGAFISPLVCGYLGQKINWHVGFAAAGFGMVSGSCSTSPAASTSCRSERSNESRRADRRSPSRRGGARPRVHARGLGTHRRRVHPDLLRAHLLGRLRTGRIEPQPLRRSGHAPDRLQASGYPSSWFQSVEPLFVIIFSPIFAWLWLWMGRRNPSSPAKFTFGLFCLALSFLLMVPAAKYFEASHMRVSPWWLVGLYFLQMVGELCLSPVGLTMVTKLSPPRIVGFMMGVWFFATAMGNYVAGWVAGFLENKTYSEVFMIAFVTSAVATLVLALLIPIIKRLMAGVH